MALSAARKARDPFMTYQGGFGNEEPVYVWFEYGKSAADFAPAEEKFWKSTAADAWRAVARSLWPIMAISDRRPPRARAPRAFGTRRWPGPRGPARRC
jgi:hypothetical protein